MEYLKYLAENSKIGYLFSNEKYEIIKKYFLRISEILYEQKDYITLGYLVYFTQYFSTDNTKKIQEMKNMFKKSK